MDVESKLQYIPIISFQTRILHHLSFVHTTAFCEKMLFRAELRSNSAVAWRTGPIG